MKASKTILFIISVLVGLAVICLVFPKEGLHVGSLHLEFPSLTEVLKVDSARNGNLADASEDINSKMLALHNAKDKEFRELIESSPTRIYCPNNDPAYLDGFFDALENAKDKPMRIMHYGDSQLECDRMTSVIRQHLQETYGGEGVGMVPVMPQAPTFTLIENVSPSDISYWRAYGPGGTGAHGSKFGPMAQVAHVNGSATINFRDYNSKEYPLSQHFSAVKVYGSGNATITLTSDTIQVTMQSVILGPNTTYWEAKLDQSIRKGRLTISGSCDIYGFSLEGLSGVSMDNVPMRGCSGTIFTGINEETLKPFFDNENVPLIILQYGGNALPYLKNNQSRESFKKQIKQQIALFKKISPHSKILFIGPADMATRVQGSLQSYPQMEDVVAMLRDAANEEGAAFWDMFAAQGGRGSMIQWTKARPQLAGSDYIHFTPKGAKQMADYLYETLSMYKRYYNFRNGINTDEEQDSVAVKDGKEVLE